MIKARKNRLKFLPKNVIFRLQKKSKYFIIFFSCPCSIRGTDPASSYPLLVNRPRFYWCRHRRCRFRRLQTSAGRPRPNHSRRRCHRHFHRPRVLRVPVADSASGSPGTRSACGLSNETCSSVCCGSDPGCRNNCNCPTKFPRTPARNGTESPRPCSKADTVAESPPRSRPCSTLGAVDQVLVPVHPGVARYELHAFPQSFSILSNQVVRESLARFWKPNPMLRLPV